MYKNLLSKNLVFKGLAWGSGSVGLSMSLGFAGKIQGPERLESGFRAHYYDKIKKWNKVSMYIKTTRRLNLVSVHMTVKLFSMRNPKE